MREQKAHDKLRLQYCSVDNEEIKIARKLNTSKAFSILTVSISVASPAQRRQRSKPPLKHPLPFNRIFSLNLFFLSQAINLFGPTYLMSISSDPWISFGQTSSSKDVWPQELPIPHIDTPSIN